MRLHELEVTKLPTSRRTILQMMIGALCVTPMQASMGQQLSLVTSAPKMAEGTFLTTEQMLNKWKAYAKAWSPVGDAERRKLLQGSLTQDFSYLDPGVECHGQKEFIKNLESFQKLQPGASFALKSFLPHHEVALINWQLVNKDGTESIQGFDFVRFGSDDLIHSITGFFVLPSSTRPRTTP